jgi:Fe-S-cluster containining protein
MSSAPGGDPKLNSLGETAQVLSGSAAKSGRYAKLATKLHLIADNEIAKLELPLACKPGCSYCCSDLVECGLPEALEIAEYVGAAFSAEELSALQERIAAYQGLLMKLFRRETVEFRVPCPFLVNDLCSIYEHRPLHCRGLTNSSAEPCKAWQEGDENRPFLPEPTAIKRSLVKGMMRGLKAGGALGDSFEMSGAVGMLLDEGEATCDRGEITAPIEKFATFSAQPEGIHPTPGFGELMVRPGFTDLWDAALKGDLPRAFNLLPAFGDSVVEELVRLGTPPIYESQDELEEHWAELGEAIGRFEDARVNPVTVYDRLPFLNVFFWAYSGKDVRPYVERLVGKIHRDVVGRAYPELASPLPEARKPGRFRLGYLGSRMINFNGSRWAGGWLSKQSPEIETFVFNAFNQEDPFTVYWRRLADHYFYMPGPDHLLAQFIRSLDLDALIFTDLSMGPFDLQRSSMRLARRQFTAWGHPVTSGSPAIEGYLSSAMMEPVGAQQHYTEKLYLLPGSGLCYPRATHDPRPVDPEKFVPPEGGYFFQAQMVSKGVPKDDPLYARICEESGKPIAFLAPARPLDQEKLERRFKKAGVNAILIPVLPGREYFDVMRMADAVLDTPAWNGGNTAIDAFAMGKPMVTMAGEFMRSRHCLAFHKIAGVEGLIASDEEEYVRLALDSERQEAVMRGLNREPLYDDEAPVRALEEILFEGF